MYPTEDLPVSSTRFTKVLIIGGAVSFIIVLIIIFSMLSSRTKGSSEISSNKPSQNGIRSNLSTGITSSQSGSNSVIKVTPTPTPLPVKNLTIAERIIRWLNLNRLSDSTYSSGPVCDEKGTCSPPQKDNLSGISVIWGRFHYAEKTNSAADNSALTSDLNVYTNENRVPTVQNDFWNCKLMYDIVTSTFTNQTQKDLAKKLCERSTYYVPDVQDVISQGNGEVAELDLKKIMNGQYQFSENKSDPAFFKQYPAYSSDFGVRYIWHKEDAGLLKRAIIYFNKSVQLLTTVNTLSDKQIGQEMVAVASVDLYNATTNPQYLEYADYLVKQFGDCQTLDACTIRLFYLKELKKIKNTSQYDGQIKTIMKYLVDSALDEAGYNGNRKTNSAFHYINKGDYFYPTRFNGLLAGLYSEFESL